MLDKYARNETVFEIVRIATLAAILSLIIPPILFVVSVSFRPPTEFFSQNVYLIPKNPTVDPWVRAWDALQTPLKNSLFVAAGTSVLSLLITIPGAYVFARKQFPGRKFGFYMVLSALLFPYILLVVPISDLWYDVGLYNTIPGLWIAYQSFIVPFAIWILRDFFEQLPMNLEEAAQVYGCTQFSAFVKVILPLSAPAVAAVGFLAFVIGWNDFLFSNMLTTGTGPRPAVVALFLSTVGGEQTYWGLMMAESLIIGLPPTALYLASRRYLTQAFAVT